MYLPDNPPTTTGVVDSRTTTTARQSIYPSNNNNNNQHGVGTRTTNSWSTRKSDSNSFLTYSTSNQKDLQKRKKSEKRHVETGRYQLYSTSIDYFDGTIENEDVVRTQSSYRTSQLKTNTEYLFDIPESLFPEYQQPTTTTQIAIIAVSALLSFVSKTISVKTILSTKFWSSIFIKSIKFLQNQQRFHHHDFHISTNVFKNIVSFAVKALAFQVLFKTLWQEKFLSPSRISTTDLQNQYYLPSNISNYDIVQLFDNTTISDNNDTAIGVHWIEYINQNIQKKKASDDKVDATSSTSSSTKAVDVVYFNHGFGASSLSWLPVIPKLTNLFNAQYGLGHDAVGFGFTDRPKQINNNNNNTHLHYYTADYSAKIAVSLIMSRLTKLMEEKLRTKRNDNLVNKKLSDISLSQNNILDKETYSVTLFGHSMGAITTLRTALKLQKVFNNQYSGTNKSLKLQLFLVAPALGFTNIHENVKHITSTGGPYIGRIVQRIFGPIGFIIVKYILRRVVGTSNFWKRGLVFAWGDKNKLSQSDVVRYQWPSIGTDWEDGIINFATAQTTKHTTVIDKEPPKSNIGIRRDEDLLRAVLTMPEVEKVNVILGGKDRVIPTRIVYKFLANFPTVTITQLDNSGHDPFEEETELFVDTVSALR